MVAKRSLHLASVVVALALTTAGARTSAADAAIAPRVVGGATVSVTAFPWQVAIVLHAQPNAGVGQFCGGVIRDALHVITAAHCLDVQPQDGLVDDPSERDVVAGASNLSAPEATAQRIRIASWTRMPAFDAQALTNDAAVATLTTPLDVAAAGVRPAVITAPGDLTPVGVRARVSGYGKTPFSTTTLHAADLLTVSDPACAAFTVLGALDAATELCAIAPGRDSCFGDSGGPLTLEDETLIGLVSGGAVTCADPSGAPGVYTELAQSAIAAYIRDPTGIPGDEYHPPSPTAPPTLTGVAKAGEPQACEPGAWDGAPAPEIDYRFRDSGGTALRGWSADPVYVPTAADGGRRVVCVVRARDARGAAVAVSTPGDPVLAPPAGAPVATPPAATPPATVPDTTAPRSVLRSLRCRHTTCTLRIGATDGGGSGVRRVRITLLPRRGAARTLTARRIADGLYEGRFRRVARGTAWFLCFAEDLAGNRQMRLAIRHATVR